MLRGLLSDIVEDHTAVVEREKGVAFLFSAREIYGLADILYFCVNIPRRSSGSFVHCAFGSDSACQAMTPKAIPAQRLQDLDIIKLSRSGQGNAEQSDVAVDDKYRDVSAMPLTTLAGEVAVLGLKAGGPKVDGEFDAAPTPSRSELAILGNYFHSHMLRRNGIDSSEGLVVSARELDCLRWMAAGKSAWEASVILGISERTVRFHLNSAREKLDCTTTTQAVAKVVAQQLIAL